VRAPRISLNDDKSPLIGLLSCIVCKETMKLEKSAPDAEGKDIIQYRCKRCDRIGGCDSSAEVAMRRTEGEGKISIAAFLRGVDLTVIGTTFQNRALF
jgi:hypothetical protein